MTTGRAHALTIGLALAAAAAGLVLGRWWHGGAPPSPAPEAVPAAKVARIGDPAPAFELPDTAGQLRTLQEWRGQPLLLNFWASWCAPCVREMPMLDQFAAAQPEGGTRVLGIALDDLDAVQAFLRDTPVRYPNLIEAAGSTDTSVRYGNTRAVLPFSVLVDAEGRIARLRVGDFDDGDELARWGRLD